jgi:aspartyl-tRNA(Asn)/glutamyl-tRNA(Gln) amidotransferase subunit A
MTTDIASMSLAQVAKAIARGKISSAEATQSCIKGLDTLGRTLNALAAIDPDQAMKAARKADRERAAGKKRGPLHGVPLAHKDMYYRRGRLSECGAIIRKGFVPSVTATALERLDAAGALDIARLNMVEFAMGATGHNPHTGTPKNPWNPEYIPGGSSSGPGVAVAARLVYGALGSDTGGSIRMPSAFCGLVGIKGTYGLVSRYGAMPLSFSNDHVGPMTRTVEDCALMLQVIAGQDPKDATSAAQKVPNYRADLEKGVRGRTIAVAHGWFRQDMAPEVVKLLDQAVEVYRKMGAKIVPVEVPSLDHLNDAAQIITGAEAASFHVKWLDERPQDYSSQVRTRLQQGVLYPAVRYLDALRLRERAVSWFVGQMIGRADAMLVPALSIPLPTIRETDATGDPKSIELMLRMARNTRPFNYLGLPALSIPCGFTGNGLPAGFQLVGRPFAEAMLFRVGRAYERETGITDRAPPNCHHTA